MKFYKMGDGPVYTFYRPFHLGPLETVQSVARAVLLRTRPSTPLGAPVTRGVAQAKRDLTAGETLDGIGGSPSTACSRTPPPLARDELLPMGLTDGAVLVRDLPRTRR